MTVGIYSKVFRARRLAASLAIVVVSVSAVFAQTVFVQAPQDPYRDLSLSEFSSPANPFLCDPNLAYVWGCAFFSGWNLDLGRFSAINHNPEIGAIQRIDDRESYIVQVTDSTHWIADSVVRVKGKTVWQEQSVTVTDAKNHLVLLGGDKTPQRLSAIIHPPTKVHAFYQKSTKSILVPGETLQPGQSLTSPDGKTVLTMQTNGDLVLSQQTGTTFNAIWSTGTGGNPGSTAEVMPSGDVQVVSPTNSAIWSTDTGGSGPVDLSVNNDGTATVVNFYDRAIWSTD